jgi:hypothetical protein
MRAHNPDPLQSPPSPPSPRYNDDMTDAWEELKEEIDVGLQALSVNLVSSLRAIQFLLVYLIVLGIIALIHFW